MPPTIVHHKYKIHRNDRHSTEIKSMVSRKEPKTYQNEGIPRQKTDDEKRVVCERTKQIIRTPKEQQNSGPSKKRKYRRTGKKLKHR